MKQNKTVISIARNLTLVVFIHIIVYLQFAFIYENLDAFTWAWQSRTAYAVFSAMVWAIGILSMGEKKEQKGKTVFKEILDINIEFYGKGDKAYEYASEEYAIKLLKETVRTIVSRQSESKETKEVAKD